MSWTLKSSTHNSWLWVQRPLGLKLTYFFIKQHTERPAAWPCLKLPNVSHLAEASSHMFGKSDRLSPVSLTLPSPAQSWRAQFAHLSPAWHGCETVFPGCPAQETFKYDSWEVERSPWSASWPQSSVWLATWTSLPTAGRGEKSSHVWSTLVQPWIIIFPSLHLHYLAWVKSHQSGVVGLVE